MRLLATKLAVNNCSFQMPKSNLEMIQESLGSLATARIRKIKCLSDKA